MVSTLLQHVSNGVRGSSYIQDRQLWAMAGKDVLSKTDEFSEKFQTTLPPVEKEIVHVPEDTVTFERFDII